MKWPFPDTQELHPRSTWKANFCIFQYISARKLLFQRRRKLLSGEGLNNFLKAGRCLGLVKCFKIFHFNWNFWKSNCFSNFRYFQDGYGEHGGGLSCLDRSELQLLKTTTDFKAKNAYEGVHLECVKDKYTQPLSMFVLNFP